MLEDPELTDTVIDMHFCVPGRIDRHTDHIIIAAVRLIDHSDRIGLDKSVVFEQ